MKLRPLAELLTSPDPPPIHPSEVVAVGTLDGHPWHSSGHMAIAGGSPDGTPASAREGYEFDGWVTGKTWRAAEPVGWDYLDDANPKRPVVQFSPEWVPEREPGNRGNFANGDYFRTATRLGAEKWEYRADGKLLRGMKADGEMVAIIACMWFPAKGDAG